MGDIRFEWDPAKAAANARKHGVGFEEAATAFSDDFALVIDDPDHSDQEDRLVLLGLSAMSASWWSCTPCDRRKTSSASSRPGKP